MSESVNLLNEAARHDYLSEQIQRLKGSRPDRDGVRQSLQALIEEATSIRLGHKDRAALRSYLQKFTARFRSGEIDERTAKVGLNKVIMAAAANSPDVLHYIHLEA